MTARRLLVLNPGSTSTKVSVFEDEREVDSSAVAHDTVELSAYPTIAAQHPMRLSAIRAFLEASDHGDARFDAVVGRGGLLKPVASGVYRVNDAMKHDLRAGAYGEHASNLGALLAAELAAESGCSAYIADPVVVDELDDVARFSGLPQIERRSIFHALNQKSAAREAATSAGLRYEEAGLIVAHMGGGVSVGAHRNGRVVDVNNALDGDGPFSPERAGSLPAGQLVSIVLSGDYDERTLRRMLTGGGGLVAYCGTNSLLELRERAGSGGSDAAAAIDAMAYQISQEIARHGATLRGRVDLIVLTGGMAHDDGLVAAIRDRVGFLAPVRVIPGEREMLSLARAALRVLTGFEQPKEYV